MKKRITPAGAGKTERREGCQQIPEDHPRRCGENDYVHSNLLRHVGSPPQVRGKLIAAAVIATATGITPAGAGKTKKLRMNPGSG